MLSVGDIMTPREQLVTLEPADSLEAARELMATRQIRHIPVVDDGGMLVGLVSHRDLLAATGSGLAGLDAAAGDVRRLDGIMSTEVEVVDSHASLRAAGEFMHRHRYGCLPVVENEALIGIITDSDYLEVALTLLEQAEETEPEELEVSD